jgi:excisionase family DNA binding protein
MVPKWGLRRFFFSARSGRFSAMRAPKSSAPRPRLAFPAPLDALLTPPDLSEITGWALPTIYSKVSRKEIAFVKLGRSLRFRRSDVERMIRAGVRPALNGPAAVRG